MSLSGKEYKALQDALLSAFQSRADLEQMTLFRLDENLNHIAGGETLSTLVFNLIQWAEARGRTQELVKGARAHNPGNSALQAFASAYLGGLHADSAAVASEMAGKMAGKMAGEVDGDQISVGDISNASGVAIGTNSRVTISHNYYGGASNRASAPHAQEPETGSHEAENKEAGGDERGDLLPDVFVSYAWGGESEAIVDTLEAAFQEKGITLLCDKHHVHYKERIRDFMGRMGRGKCVIVVISKAYLTSENCMFELIEIAKHGEFADRIFPIVLADAEIYTPVKRIQYISHWEREIRELDDAMRSVSAANLQGFRESIDLYTEIRNTIARLLDILADMNALTPEMHQSENFAKLIDGVESKRAEAC